MEELALPDVYHGAVGGRSFPKVRAIEKWKRYTPWYATSPRHLNPLDVTGSPKIFLWSDLHFGHKNIIQYAERPYPNPELMNECLIGNYLNTVTNNDIVIFGGDIGFMSETKINDILTQLPGYKIGIIGNHDIHRDGKLYNLALDERHACYVIDVDDVDDVSYQLLITHYPMNDVPIRCINVHGHIHQRPAPTSRHFNMSVEHTNYAPIPIAKILEQGHAMARAYW
jgi:calcineurin-like phosphoesterase family protein